MLHMCHLNCLAIDPIHISIDLQCLLQNHTQFMKKTPNIGNLKQKKYRITEVKEMLISP